MITLENKIKFCQATGYWNSGDEDEFNTLPADSCAAICDNANDVGVTSETVEDFIKVWGQPSETLKTPVGDLLVWKNVQTAKNRRRGDSFLMDFGTGRAGYFTGEAA